MSASFCMHYAVKGILKGHLDTIFEWPYSYLGIPLAFKSPYKESKPSTLVRQPLFPLNLLFNKRSTCIWIFIDFFWVFCYITSAWIGKVKISISSSILLHGGLYRWRENSFLFFLYQKLKEILTGYSRTILTASKNWLISKIWRDL